MAHPSKYSASFPKSACLLLSAAFARCRGWHRHSWSPEHTTRAHPSSSSTPRLGRTDGPIAPQCSVAKPTSVEYLSDNNTRVTTPNRRRLCSKVPYPSSCHRYRVHFRRPPTMPFHRYLTPAAALWILTQLLDEAGVVAHGRLMDPPARNSMWRFGFPTPVNYNDNELYCGGYSVQWEQNHGQCGVCGDAYNVNAPRPHEAGGQFAKGVIGRRYFVGQEVDVEVELTANHWGRFELFLCPNNNPKYEATQSCFERYPLYISGTRDVRFLIPGETKKKEIFRYRVRLPPYVTCSQCVLQWTYYTGNMWGVCPNGTEAVGCGQPETFRNCADISITTVTAGLPPLFISQFNPFALYFRDSRLPNLIQPLIIRAQVCVATPNYRILPGMDYWCQTNCLRYPPNCPPELCYCPEECDAIGELRGRLGADVYCQDQCIIYPPKCPANRCQCY